MSSLKIQRILTVLIHAPYCPKFPRYIYLISLLSVEPEFVLSRDLSGSKEVGSIDSLGHDGEDDVDWVGNHVGS